MTKSLRSIIPLSLALIALAGYQFIGATWQSAPPNPPNGNTEPPIHTGISVGDPGGPTNQNVFGRIGIDSVYVYDSLSYLAGAEPGPASGITPGSVLIAVDDQGRMAWGNPPTDESLPMFNYRLVQPAFPDEGSARDHWNDELVQKAFDNSPSGSTMRAGAFLSTCTWKSGESYPTSNSEGLGNTTKERLHSCIARICRHHPDIGVSTSFVEGYHCGLGTAPDCPALGAYRMNCLHTGDYSGLVDLTAGEDYSNN